MAEPKVKFDYTPNKDAWSWAVILRSKDMWGMDWTKENKHIPKELQKKMKNTSLAKSISLAEAYIKSEPQAKLKAVVIKQQLTALEKSWRKVEKKYFKTLESITQQPIFTTDFTCYITTGFMCPYEEKENYFFSSMWHDIPFSITTICHETMHLQFLHYYKNILKKKGMKVSQIEDLKESLTFLLNEPEFKDIILSYDSGYPSHQKLRSQLQEIWSKDKNFDHLIERSLPLLNK